MTPRRIDRLAIHARLSHSPVWILEVLLDAFEPAALAAAGVAEKKRETSEPRARRAPEPKDTAND